MEQEIFDAVFAMIDDAERFILLDMFLYNDFQGAQAEQTRTLCGQLTDRLIARREARPGIEIHVITDPINTVYGGMSSPHLSRLTAAGIPVTLTDLSRLRDSNPIYSAAWRLFARPFGNRPGDLAPNPFGEGRVSIRSYFSLLNFKANHRKLIVTDGPRGLVGLVTSANPHDGSSAHQNVALQFTGLAAADLLEAERAVLEFSGAPKISFEPSLPAASESGLRVKIISEKQIEKEAISMLELSGGRRDSEGATIELVMFYLSDRHIVEALRSAAKRGASVRIILDPNKDAFGHEKNGIPNRQVAAELHDVPGIEIRWADTHGEQCHSKMLLVRERGGLSKLLLGSANFTRRNLHDLNLELNALASGPSDEKLFQRAHEYFEQIWHNENQRSFTVAYDAYRDDSRLRYWRYRVMEATGLSTF